MGKGMDEDDLESNLDSMARREKGWQAVGNCVGGALVSCEELCRRSNGIGGDGEGKVGLKPVVGPGVGRGESSLENGLHILRGVSHLGGESSLLTNLIFSFDHNFLPLPITHS